MLQDSVVQKLQGLVERHEELSALLGDPDVITDQNRFRDLSKEYSTLEDVVVGFKKYQEASDGIANAQEMLTDKDPDMREMAQEDLKENKTLLEKLSVDLQKLLLPKDPNDAKNTFLEIRAGTGGDEAALFVGNLFRMYSKYAEKKRWQVEIMNENRSEQGGYKEIILRISGQMVYSRLKFESGAHRVQRVPETESQGRIHTSACTVVIMPEADAVDTVEINTSDLRIDTFRASGSGGQHVNKTDSAIRLTHLPTGTVVECQDERSQHKNKAKAMAMLQARIQATEDAKAKSEETEIRRNLVGTGDRSDRIRTYNYPQGRMTDHRINLTLYKLDEVMEGDIDQIIEPLVAENQADQLASLADSAD